MRSRKSTVQSCKYYTVQFREKNGHSNITVNRNYYGQRLASKLPVFDRKSYRFFLRVYVGFYVGMRICVVEYELRKYFNQSSVHYNDQNTI